jgi:serine/threonine protein kinase
VRPGLSLVWDDFQIIEKLGSGNMGAVYLAHQKSQGRDVALKVLYQHLSRHGTFVQRFFREAEAMLRLNHPVLVRCHGVGVARGCPYLAMELVRGCNSARLLRAVGGRFSLGDALHVVLRCAEALQHAHEHHIIHRDVKPENILLTPQGDVKLADLGLARPLDNGVALTDSGVAVGTPLYMAPEVMINPRQASPRSDIYALGGVLYSYLTGQTPFQAATAGELLLLKRAGRYPDARRLNSEVPRRLGWLLGRMLARNPARRCQDCGELLREIQHLQLASTHLGFDLLAACCDPRSTTAENAVGEQIEVLLIHDDQEATQLAYLALGQSTSQVNLNVVANGQEAQALLRGQGNYLFWPRPHLVLLALDLTRQAGLSLLDEFHRGNPLQGVPLVVLSSNPGAARVVQARGLAVDLVVTETDDIPALEDLLKSVHDLNVTVVQPLRA